MVVDVAARTRTKEDLGVCLCVCERLSGTPQCRETCQLRSHHPWMKSRHRQGSRTGMLQTSSLCSLPFLFWFSVSLSLFFYLSGESNMRDISGLTVANPRTISSYVFLTKALSVWKLDIWRRENYRRRARSLTRKLRRFLVLSGASARTPKNPGATFKHKADKKQQLRKPYLHQNHQGPESALQLVSLCLENA